ncbi:MAG: AI-2E family transporter [Clostridia bacterium]|nr:AI-2E family transporter [Clostridia bacterium]
MFEDKQGKYLKLLLTGFGSLALATVFFFLIYRGGDLKSAIDGLGKILRPFIIGAAIAYLLAPLCSKLEELFMRFLPRSYRKLVSRVSIVLALIIFCTIVYAMFLFVIPQVYYSVVNLINTAPARFDKVYKDIEMQLGNDPVLQQYFEVAYAGISDYISAFLKDKLIPNVGSIISGVGLGVVNFLVFAKDFLIGIIITIYLLAGRKSFKKGGDMAIRAMFKPASAESVFSEIRYADKMFTSFFSGKLLDSAIVGVICYIFCSAVDMPNAPLIAVIIGITNIIPFFGPFIGAIPSIILIFIESPAKALIFAIFVVVLQQVDGNIIGPKIIGNSTGLSSFWVLFAILVFGGLFGFVGMIIGVPVFAVIYDVVRKLVVKGYDRNMRIAEEEAALLEAEMEIDSSEFIPE